MGKKLYFEQMHCSIQPCLPRPHPVLKCRASHRMTGDRGQRDQTFLSSLPVDKGPGSIESGEDTYCSSKMASIEYCSDAMRQRRQQHSKSSPPPCRSFWKHNSLSGTSCNCSWPRIDAEEIKGLALHSISSSNSISSPVACRPPQSTRPPFPP